MKLLVIDDDEISCRLIKAIFKAEGMDVVAAIDGRSGLKLVVSEQPDAIVLDLKLPDFDGLALLKAIKDSSPDIPVVVLSGNTQVKTAVRATQLGAFDYLTKPIDHDEVVLVMRRAVENRALKVEVEDLRRRVGKDGGLAERMGPSRQIAEIIEQTEVVARSNFTVLVLGETGTGKELVAQAIHRKSERSSKAFIALDCGAIPENLLESELFGHERGSFTGADRRKQGRFELAQGGTFFLDEVANMPMALQAKLLRVLESKEMQSVGATKHRALDVRFIAATNDDLQERVTHGHFRADLYFRLAQYTVSVPPLRERIKDIEYLAQRFLEEARVELRRPVQRFSSEAIEVMQRYAWPGNVRELRNVVRNAVLQTRDLIIEREALKAIAGKARGPRDVSASNLSLSLREIADRAASKAEHEAICNALIETRGNRARAAKLLQIDAKTLYRKMKALEIRPVEYSL